MDDPKQRGEGIARHRQNADVRRKRSEWLLTLNTTPRSEEVLFTWLSLLFLKIHLKDGKVPLHKDRRRGSNVIGDAYEWSVLHHIHAVARSPYTGVHLLPGVVGSVCLYEINRASTASDTTTSTSQANTPSQFRWAISASWRCSPTPELPA